MSKGDALWKLLEEGKTEPEAPRGAADLKMPSHVACLPACVLTPSEPEFQIPPGGMPINPTLLAQFRAAVENFNHFLGEEVQLRARLAKGIAYCQRRVEDGQAKRWLEEIAAKPAGDVGGSMTFKLLEERIKRQQPTLLEAVQLLGQLRREHASLICKIEWEAGVQHDVEKTMLGDRPGFICATCYALVVDGVCKACWPTET